MFGPNFWLHGQRNAAMFYWSHYTRAVRIKLKNTTDLFYRQGSILVTFLVIYLWFCWVYFNQSPRFASSSRSCLRGPELGLGLRQIAHNIVKQIIVIEYRPAIGRRYSLFVHKMGVGLYWSSKIFLILSSIIILQFAVVLAVSNVIWVRTSSCCEFKLVVMGTICIL